LSAAATPAPPSIGARLANALLSWSVAWGLAVGLAVWLAATHEVDELLDDALQSSAELMAEIVRARGEGAPAVVVQGKALERFAWQVVGSDGAVLLRSPRAPDQPWHRSPQVGFGDVPQWRVFGQVLGSGGRMLYAAQSRAERDEARAEVALGAVLAALAVGLLGHLWLRLRVRRELEPLQRLSQRLSGWDPEGGGAAEQIGPAERSELQPVHGALETLTVRLAARMANEQAFSAHAAHALRTPLAGIDAQLAVALRECPPELPQLHQRLLRVRGAATRLQAVVAALLGLFRSGEGGGRVATQAVDLPALVARLPVPGLAVQVHASGPLQADPDLLAAALMNLLDNAQRHGAGCVQLRATAPATLRIDDDGPGVSAERLAQLREAIAGARTTEATGLGLMLADRVARAHGGRLLLPDTAQGFAVELQLQAESVA
jgi:signal transduction histidine kinase